MAGRQARSHLPGPDHGPGGAIRRGTPERSVRGRGTLDRTPSGRRDDTTMLVMDLTGRPPLYPLLKRHNRLTASRYRPAAMSAPSRARVGRIRDRLRDVYGRPIAPPHGRALDELILTVLSQSTSDRNRDVAFLRLRERFGTWEAVRDAPNAEVEA